MNCVLCPFIFLTKLNSLWKKGYYEIFWLFSFWQEYLFKIEHINSVVCCLNFETLTISLKSIRYKSFLFIYMKESAWFWSIMILCHNLNIDITNLRMSQKDDSISLILPSLNFYWIENQSMDCFYFSTETEFNYTILK